MNIERKKNCFLVGFKDYSTRQTSLLSVLAWQRPMSRYIIGPREEFITIILLNRRSTKWPPMFIFIVTN